MAQLGLDIIDPKFFCVVAQLSHFAWGALIITWSAILFPHAFYWIWGIGQVLAAIKEFWYDANYENAATRGSDLLDFSMYTAGATTAFLACHFLAHII